MRWEAINWKGRRLFQPRGKTRNSSSSRAIERARSSPCSEIFSTNSHVDQRLESFLRRSLDRAYRTERNSSTVSETSLSRSEFGCPEALLPGTRSARSLWQSTKIRDFVKKSWGMESLTTTMGYLHPETAQIKSSSTA